MRHITFATLTRLLLASFFVGIALACFDVTPRELLAWARGLARGPLADFWSWVSRGASYVLLGGIIVVPLWLLSVAWKAFRGKR